MSNTDATLAVRGSRYGLFSDQAQLTQELKDVMRSGRNWRGMQADQKEALEMIASKIVRIVNGDADYDDSWHDIQGYARLVEERLLREKEVNEENPVASWHGIPYTPEKETDSWGNPKLCSSSQGGNTQETVWEIDSKLGSAARYQAKIEADKFHDPEKERDTSISRVPGVQHSKVLGICPQRLEEQVDKVAPEVSSGRSS